MKEEVNMASHAKSKLQAAETILAKDWSDKMEQAEIVRGVPRVSAPTSIRLSAPLLEAIDRLAAMEHRKRGNMVQHILWEYVNHHSFDNVAISAFPGTSATTSPARHTASLPEKRTKIKKKAAS
ncbi:MAG TPA: hypothetical protein VGZ00_01865 [Candidatus Baltobacteraceae bacterium]|nr:hypothetical protein [Candidatus Baltobacteraceae bacterium]